VACGLKRAAMGREHDRAMALLAGQNRALELVASNVALPEVLDYLMRFLESQAPGMLCSVLLLEGDHLRHGSAPSLPDAYNQAIDGAAIGPAAGSCGTAAYRGQRVVVTDIATDPLWADYAELALRHGLRACWSTPIRASSGEVLGTFAIYYREPGAPRPEHLELIGVATHLAGIAIERRRKDEALAARTRELVEVGRRKDEFIALLAHELRNPLAPIVTALELLRRHRPDPAVERYCGIIDRQTHVLTRLVDDLLDLSRASRGALALRRERTTAAAVIARAVEASRPLLEGAHHALKISVPDEPIELEVDPIRINQVLCNLLNNAAKYTEPGGHIEVRAARDGAQVLLAVRDDGLGIAPEMRSRVFELFVQAEGASAHAPGGLGIGLTLVKSLVELHGGHVEAFSEGLGHGTEVRIWLPAAASGPALLPAEGRDAPRLTARSA